MSSLLKRGDLYTIGEVINQVISEFEDISISKIRFLEAEGLLVPARSKSGYRKFSNTDVEKIRYILRMQRDHYLPLKVIKEHIEAINRGLTPENQPADKPKVPNSVIEFNPNLKKANIRVTKEELLTNTGITEDDLLEAQQHGLITVLADKRHYDDFAIRTARVISSLSEFGLHPRHLKLMKSGSEREVSLIKQVVAPMAVSRRPDAQEQAESMTREVSSLTNQLHAILVSNQLDKESL